MAPTPSTSLAITGSIDSWAQPKSSATSTIISSVRTTGVEIAYLSPEVNSRRWDARSPAGVGWTPLSGRSTIMAARLVPAQIE